MIDATMARRYSAELIGTALLVFFGAGMATVNFGFRAFGSSVAAGILLTGLTFGLVLLGLVAVIGPISGCHVNPAVTLGAFLARRMTVLDLVGYWVSQLIGGLLGALLLLWVMHTSPFYSRPRIGLGANGYGSLSLLHASAGGAFLIEVIITAVFVLMMLSATRPGASVPVARPDRRSCAGSRQRDRHPDRRRVGEPGAELRPGDRRRRPVVQPAMAVHHRAAGGRGPGSRTLHVVPPGRRDTGRGGSRQGAGRGHDGDVGSRRGGSASGGHGCRYDRSHAAGDHAGGVGCQGGWHRGLERAAGAEAAWPRPGAPAALPGLARAQDRLTRQKESARNNRRRQEPLRRAARVVS